MLWMGEPLSLSVLKCLACEHFQILHIHEMCPVCPLQFQSDPEYKVLCSVYKALLEEVVGSEVPSVVSEAIDDLHYNCVQSPRGRYQDVVLGITLDLVSEVVTEETQVEVRLVIFFLHEHTYKELHTHNERKN